MILTRMRGTGCRRPRAPPTLIRRRRALLDAAAALLDAGGPEAVTLREVGARAGVSRMSSTIPRPSVRRSGTFGNWWPAQMGCAMTGVRCPL